MKIAVINGPNMNMLGIRQPDIYGIETYSSLVKRIELFCNEIGIDVSFFQSNHEGEIIDFIQQCYGNTDGIVINPAAYTHTSVAIADAVASVAIPTVEVHISDISSREDYRKISYIRPCCISSVIGKGSAGYLDAVNILKNHYESNI